MVGMQGAVDVQVANLLDVAAVVVHDEQLQDGRRVALGRCEAVAVTGEHDLPPGSGQGPRL